MPFRSRGIAREFGAAFAVLAIYVFVLLVPLHQAAGLQRDLGKLGFESIAWSICAASTDTGGETRTPVKCAVSGIGKNELFAAAPVAIDLEITRPAERVAYVSSATVPVPPSYASGGRPRAPPVAV